MHWDKLPVRLRKLRRAIFDVALEFEQHGRAAHAPRADGRRREDVSLGTERARACHGAPLDGDAS